MADEARNGVRPELPAKEGGPSPLPTQRRAERLKSADEGMQESERLLLSWMAEYPMILEQVKPFLGPYDFTEGVHLDLAEAIYRGDTSQESYSPAALISSYELEEDQAEVARIFHTGENILEKPEDWTKALQETVFRLKQRTITEEQKRMDPRDPDRLKRTIEGRKLLDQLRRTDFRGPQ